MQGSLQNDFGFAGLLLHEMEQAKRKIKNTDRNFIGMILV
jgi:hypothetical protein